MSGFVLSPSGALIEVPVGTIEGEKMLAANDNKDTGEWVVTFIPTRFLAALDR
jgi:hypothetical protein